MTVRLSSLNRGGRDGLPDLPLGKLAVAGHHVGADNRCCRSVPPGRGRSRARALAERPVEASTPPSRFCSVAFQRTAPASGVMIARAGSSPPASAHRAPARMPLREDEAVPVGPSAGSSRRGGGSRRNRARHHFGRRQRAAGMPRAGLGRHPDNRIPADRLGPGQQRQDYQPRPQASSSPIPQSRTPARGEAIATPN